MLPTLYFRSEPHIGQCATIPTWDIKVLCPTSQSTTDYISISWPCHGPATEGRCRKLMALSVWNVISLFQKKNMSFFCSRTDTLQFPYCACKKIIVSILTWLVSCLISYADIEAGMSQQVTRFYCLLVHKAFTVVHCGVIWKLSRILLSFH